MSSHDSPHAILSSHVSYILGLWCHSGHSVVQENALFCPCLPEETTRPSPAEEGRSLLTVSIWTGEDLSPTTSAESASTNGYTMGGGGAGLCREVVF